MQQYNGTAVEYHGSMGGDTISGGDEGNLIYGESGDDYIVGGSGSDTLVGGAGNDTIFGGGGEDMLRGGGGDDYLSALGASKSTGIEGGSGNDTLVGSVPGYGQIHMRAGDGDDLLILDVSNDTVPGGGLYSYQGHHAYGGRGSDRFEFTNVDNVHRAAPVLGRIDDFDASRDSIWIDGQKLDFQSLPKGMDVVEYQGQQWLRIGSNIIYALEGARDGGVEKHFSDLPQNISSLQVVTYIDQVNYVPYHLYESFEGDLHEIVSSENYIVGTGRSDWIYSDAVSVSDSPDLANTSIDGGAGNDVIDSGKGMDSVSGGSGDDMIAGGVDNDKLWGNAGNDIIFGGSENDTIYGGQGADIIDGGTGIDTADFSTATGTVIVNLLDGVGNLDDATGDTYVSIEYVVGSGFADKVIGTAGNNFIAGGGGNDQLIGYLGNDRLLGDDGNDILRGEAGADRLEGGNGGDWTWYATSNAGVSVNLTSNTGAGGHAQGDTFDSIEYAYGSSFNDVLVGNTGGNYLVGAGGDDAINGKAGNDRLRGGAGTDTLWGDVGADSFDFNMGDEQDTIADFEDNIDTLDFRDMGFANVDEALSFAYETGGNTAFDFVGADMVIVMNATIAQLSDDILV